MKKRLVILLSVILAVGLLFSGCSGLEGLTNSVGEVKYQIVDDHAEVVALPNGSDDKEIIIADEYEGKPVTVIKEYIGSNLEAAEKIHIGKNVSEIGVWSFSNNQKLNAYEVDPANENFCCVDGAVYTKDMKTLLYYPCSGNTNYKMPDTVETVAPRAFYKNESIKNITLSISLKEIKEMAFFQCTGITELTLPETLELISKDAFTKCTGLTEITIPSSIAEIEEYAFYNCTEVRSVIVNKNKDDIKLGTKWYPTNNGNKIDDLKIEYK